MDLDGALTQQLRAGSREALESMFQQHAPHLLRFAAKLTHSSDVAHDVVQDVFVWVWETRAQFAPKTSVRAYLFGAVRHRALDVLRRERVRGHYVNDVPRPASVSSPAEGVERAELERVIAQALGKLSPRVRQVAELRWWGQLSYKEIAVVLGVSERTVNTQLTGAVKVLRGELEGYRL